MLLTRFMITTAMVLIGTSPALAQSTGEIIYVPGTATYDTNIPNGQTWFNLSCRRDDCYLKNVKLHTKPAKIQDMSSGEYVKGQTISFPDNGQTSIVLLQGMKWLKNKKVVTYYNADAGEPPVSSSSGSTGLEIEFKNNLGTTVTITPDFTMNDQGQILKVEYYLHVGNDKQLLGEINPAPPESSFDDYVRILDLKDLPVGTALLQWAGDIDGDGKLDLVMSIHHVPTWDISRILFLSSAAKKGDLVGIAGKFHFAPPSSGGC